ncbi:7775_t:CDS:2, partial [Scutellospora calospora]
MKMVKAPFMEGCILMNLEHSFCCGQQLPLPPLLPSAPLPPLAISTSQLSLQISALLTLASETLASSQ